jgi:hypothetical protein
MALGTEVMAIVMAIIGFFVGAFFLWLSAAKIFRLKDKSFRTPLIISLIVSAVGYLLNFVPVNKWASWIIVVLVALWMVKYYYKTSWGKAVLVWLVYYALMIIVMMIITAILLATVFAGVGVMSALG